ncbi:MAG: TonB-dependent receptor plug domain-containing protein, partial [Nitrospiria bacterium]
MMKETCMRTNNKNKRFFSLFLVGIIWTALIAAQPAAGQENEEPIELETMEVEEQEPTVRQQVEKDFKASKTTTSISERETRDFNAANPSDALRLIPGVNFTFGEGSRFGNPDAIRGVTGFPTPDAIDGFPVIRSPGTGAEGAGFNGIGSVIPSIAISEIEVARGSQGVMFGGQTEGGIFLTKLKRGRRGPIQGTLYAEYADIREELYMGEIGGATDDGRYDIYIAGRQLVGDYENVVTDRGTRLLKEDILGGLVKAGFEPIKDIRIELLMITNDNEIVAEEVPGMPSINNLDFRFYGISWVHEVFQGIGYEVSYSRVTDENGFLEPGAFQSLRRADQSNLVGSIYVIRQLSDSVGYSGALGIEHAENDALQEILLGGSGVLDLQFEDDSIYFLNTLTYDDRISVNA